MFLSRRNRMVQKKIEEYFASVHECLITFRTAIDYWFEHGIDARVRTYFDRTHAQESKADDILMEIDVMLYEKTLLPESRRDILILLERADNIPDQAETALNRIEARQIVLPDFMRDETLELVRISVEAGEQVAEIARQTLGTNCNVLALVEEVDRLESVCDRIEQSLTRKLFRSSLDKADKIICGTLIEDIGDISDHCENVANFLKIFHIKRLV
jgi:uncharacterized protein